MWPRNDVDKWLKIHGEDRCQCQKQSSGFVQHFNATEQREAGTPCSSPMKGRFSVRSQQIKARRTGTRVPAHEHAHGGVMVMCVGFHSLLDAFVSVCTLKVWEFLGQGTNSYIVMKRGMSISEGAVTRSRHWMTSNHALYIHIYTHTQTHSPVQFGHDDILCLISRSASGEVKHVGNVPKTKEHRVS